MSFITDLKRFNSDARKFRINIIFFLIRRKETLIKTLFINIKTNTFRGVHMNNFFNQHVITDSYLLSFYIRVKKKEVFSPSNQNTP